MKKQKKKGISMKGQFAPEIKLIENLFLSGEEIKLINELRLKSDLNGDRKQDRKQENMQEV